MKQDIAGFVRSVVAGSYTMTLDKTSMRLPSEQVIDALGLREVEFSHDQTTQDIARILPTVPAFLAPSLAIDLIKKVQYPVGSEFYGVVRQPSIPCWVTWCANHNRYVSSVVRWAEYYLTHLKDLRWSPVRHTSSLALGGYRYTDLIKMRPSAVFPLEDLGYLSVCREFLEDRQMVQEWWVREYLNIMQRIDQHFYSFGGQYRSKKKVVQLAERLCYEGDSMTRLCANRPIPFVRDLDDIPYSAEMELL